MKLWLASFLYLGLLSCGRHHVENDLSLRPSAHSNIVSGQTVQSEEALATHVAFISTVDAIGNTENCTGVFISRTKILTARHCIAKDLNDMSVVFRTSSFDTDMNVLDLPIIAVEISVKENISGRQDLALIEVVAPADLRAVPVQILDHSPVISELTLIGFGVTGEADFFDAQLRTRKVTVKSNQFMKINFEIDQNENQGGVCFGDSGGPALYFDTELKQYFLVGIASAVVRGQNADACLNKSIFMNVLFYKNEIKETL